MLEHKQVDIITGLLCNEKCFFCFQDTDYIKQHDTKTDIHSVIKSLIIGRKRKIDMVNISGWEPTIYKNLVDILHLSQKFWYTTIKLITNGLAFASFEYCQRHLPYITDIALSFHAPHESPQDIITWHPGSYKKLLQSLENISLFPHIRLHNHCAINAYNYDLLEEHIQYMISLGFESIHFLSLMSNTDANKENLVAIEKTAKKMMYIIDTYSHKIRIEVAYIQPCFMPWYEEYISFFEYKQDYISNNVSSLQSWETTILQNKELKEPCHDCKFLSRCYWFWKN